MFKSLLAFVMTIVSGGVKPAEVEKPVEEPAPVVEVKHELPVAVQYVKEVVEYVYSESISNAKEATEYAVVNGAHIVSEAATSAYEDYAANVETESTKDLWINLGIGFVCRNLIYIIAQVTAKAGYNYLLSDYESFIALFDKSMQTILKEIFDGNKTLYTYVMGIISKLNLGA